MKSRRRVGILGGMFDPIHDGHLDVGAAAESALALSTVLVLPSNIPPHRTQPVASSHHRFAMVAMAVAGRAGWRALDLELREPTCSYTSDTLRRLHGEGFTPEELFFVTGADAFLEIATWKDYPALFDLAHFAVVSRNGVSVHTLADSLPDVASRMREVFDPSLHAARTEHVTRSIHDVDAPTCIFLIDARTADVSSTAIRQARHDHRSIAGMVPEAVRQHIEQHDLYDADPRSTEAGAPSSGPKAGGLHGQD